jgi:hypothetical protein
LANRFVASTKGGPLTAATATTLWEITPGANAPVTLIDFWVEFDSSAAAVAADIELVQVTGRISPTSSNLTITAKGVSGEVGSSAATVKTYTAEGTGITSVDYERHKVPPTGAYERQEPQGREQRQATNPIGIRVTTATGSTPNWAAGGAWEE